MAEKTEKATPKKLRDARKKGQVAKSKDFPSAFTFIVSVTAILFSTGYFFEQLAGFMIEMFKQIRLDPQLENKAGNYILQAVDVINNVSLPILIAVVITGVLVNFLMVGPLFAMEAMKPDIKKLNPITNLKNMFKIKTFVELIKSIAKITGAVFLIYLVMKNSIGEIIASVALPVIGTAIIFNDFLLKVVIRVGLFFIVIGIFDLVFQLKNFAKEMKMEKFEVKQEYKDTEGDPHIKSKRRQRAQEIAYQEGPQAAKRARTIITNPEHIAVALEYDPNEHPAPKILTMGLGNVAEEIIKIALDNNIPIMRNVPLAHMLFEKGTISSFIPEETYQAIAEILKWIEGLETPETIGSELFK
ncbi:MAG: EscU/YscU/HrcU family type III secretion system export apparatus switch protein [Chlamydiae bacterium]|nr:EscU/YscU/HrcU family type III secretion system export apparatus switch protein [Chlamydiota bacterium]